LLEFFYKNIFQSLLGFGYEAHDSMLGNTMPKDRSFWFEDLTSLIGILKLKFLDLAFTFNPIFMTTINIYLTFNGNCREAFEFYQSVFGGEYASIGTFGEMPPQPGYTAPEADKNRIMHVSLPISKETVLMGSDSVTEYGEVVVGNNFSISINADSKAEADRFYKELSAGGKSVMPMAETFWGSYFGMMTDRFGINWMVSFDVKRT